MLEISLLFDDWRISLVVRLLTPSDRHTPVACCQLTLTYRGGLASVTSSAGRSGAEQICVRILPLLLLSNKWNIDTRFLPRDCFQLVGFKRKKCCQGRNSKHVNNCCHSLIWTCRLSPVTSVNCRRIRRPPWPRSPSTRGSWWICLTGCCR